MRISLRKELIFLVLMPHLAIISLAAEAIWSQLDRAERLENLRPLTELSIAASGVIHEFQKERGQTVGLITSGFADANAQKVAAQRELSDPAVAAFQETVTQFRTSVSSEETVFGPVFSLLEKVEEPLGQLGGHRARADQKSLTVPENVRYYTGMINDLIALTALGVKLSPSQEITALMLPYVAIVEAKENGGLERAIGAALLNRAAKGEFARGQYEAYFGRLVGERNALARFKRTASNDIQARFDETVTQDAEQAVADGRAILAAIPDTIDPKGLSGLDWFATATNRLNMFKSVEDSIAEDIRAETTAQLSAATQTIINIILVNGAIVLIFISIGLYRALPMASRIGFVVDALKKLASGSDDVVIKDDTRQDDLGDMTRALSIFKSQIDERQRLEEQQKEQAQKAAEERTVSLRRMADAVEGELQGSVNTIASEGERLSESASELSGISSEVSGNAQAVAAAAEEATSNAAIVATFANEISHSISGVVNRVNEAKQSAGNALAVASETNDVVNRLQSAASEVGDVITIISDIAEQTNLLALNATIEAARAGDAGKGFAVVASEVKGLATQTQTSAAKITDQVAGMQQITTDAVSAIARISGAIEKISEVADAIETAVDEQSTSVTEIASSAAQSSEGSQEVTKRMIDVTNSLGQLDTFATSMAELSASLQTDLKGLNSSIKRIIRTSTPEVDLRKRNVPVAVDRRRR